MTRTLALAGVLIGTAVRAVAAPSIVHAPVSQAVVGSPVRVQGTVSTTKPVLRVVLHYRAAGGGPFTDLLQSGDVRSFSFEVPAAVVTAAGIEYSIEVVAEDGVANLPAGPGNTFSVAAAAAAAPSAEASTAGSFALAVVNPEIGEAVADPQPAFYISSSSLSGLDPKTVKLTLDGKDVSGQATVSADAITFTPSGELGIGRHVLRAEARDLSGGAAEPVEATFTVTSSSAMTPEEFATVSNMQARAFSGQVALESQLPAYVTAPADKLLVAQPQYNRATLLVRGNAGILSAGLSAFVTDEDLHHKDIQPISRARIDLGLGKSFALTGGDFSPRLTELTVWNPYRVRGGQMVLTTAGADESKVRLTVFGGLSQMAIEGTLYGYDALGNPLVAGGNLAQTMFGTRVELDWFKGFMTGINFADVHETGGSVTLKPASLQPQFNQVGSVDARADVGPVFVDGEMAGSLYSRDQSTFSLGRVGGTAVRAGGGFSWQGHALTYAYKDTGRSLEIGGLAMTNFQSLGNPSLQPDYRGHRLLGQTHALNQMIMLSGYYEAWRDNLDGLRLDTAGESNTTKTNAYGGDLRIAPADWPSLGLGVSGQAQKDSSQQPQHLNSGASNLYVNLSSPALTFGTVRAFATGGVSQSTFADKAAVKFSPDLGTFGVNAQTVVDWTPAWQTVLGGAVTSAETKVFTDAGGTVWPAYATSFVSVNARVQRVFMPQLTGFVGGDIVSSLNDIPASGIAALDSQAQLDTRRTSVQLGGTWRPATSQTLTVSAGFVDSADGIDTSVRTPAGMPTRSYQEVVGNLRYSYDF